MAVTKIQWTDYSFNPWWGCEKVSPACAHCYAERDSNRYGNTGLWGKDHAFRWMSDSTWEKPLLWDRMSAKVGREKFGGGADERPRVFTASMADVFEDHPELEEPRRRLFDLIEATPSLDWLVLTKRPEFARDWLRARYWPFGGLPALAHVPDSHGCPPVAPAGVYPQNIWMGVSIENQAWTWRADVLREIPARVRFISAEPLLGSLTKLEEGNAVRRSEEGGGVEEALESDERLRKSSGASESSQGAPGRAARDGEGAEEGSLREMSSYVRAAEYGLPSSGRRNEGVQHRQRRQGESLASPRGDREVRRSVRGLPSRRPLSLEGIDWLIIGGESGGRARETQLGWIWDLLQAGHEAETAVFVKQLGKKLAAGLGLRDRAHGGDASEWPRFLKVREFPS